VKRYLQHAAHNWLRQISRHTRTLSVEVALFGPIPWGHSGPLCHALSLSLLSLSSSSSSLSWTSHAACAIAIAGVRLVSAVISSHLETQCLISSRRPGRRNAGAFRLIPLIRLVLAIVHVYNLHLFACQGRSQDFYCGGGRLKPPRHRDQSRRCLGGRVWGAGCAPSTENF